jgi:hypothetical protein
VSQNLTGHKTREFSSKNGENDRTMGMTMVMVWRVVSLIKKSFIVFGFFAILNLSSVFYTR